MLHAMFVALKRNCIFLRYNTQISGFSVKLVFEVE